MEKIDRRNFIGNDALHLPPGAYRAKYTGKYEHRTISGGIGHNLPQEAPKAFAGAILDVAKQNGSKNGGGPQPGGCAWINLGGGRVATGVAT